MNKTRPMSQPVRTRVAKPGSPGRIPKGLWGFVTSAPLQHSCREETVRMLSRPCGDHLDRAVRVPAGDRFRDTREELTPPMGSDRVNDAPQRADDRVRLLLVGAGHAHLHLLDRVDELKAAGYRVELLAPDHFAYSGVATAVTVGALPEETGTLDVVALADAGEVRHHRALLADIDLKTKTATTSHGSSIDFDLISFNIGSVVAPESMVVGEGVTRVKPLSDLVGLNAQLTASNTSAAVITVVGSGASGLELAAQLALRDDVSTVRLIEGHEHLAPSLPAGARARVAGLLAERGVEVYLACKVSHLDARSVRFEGGTDLPHDFAVLATGLRAPALVSDLGLGDHKGIPVADTLLHRDFDWLYAAGDCAAFLPTPLPRIGVHGVRQGPVLLGSLIARAQERALPTYTPPGRVLSILDLGDEMGLSVYGRLWWFGRASLSLKRWIDRRWLARYRTPTSAS